MTTDGPVLTEAEAKAATAGITTTFKCGDTDVEVLTTDRLELGELGLIKREFGFRGLLEFEDALTELDPDAWHALLYVSALRKLPAIGKDHAAFGKVNPSALLNETRERMESALEAAVAAKREENRPPADAGAGEDEPAPAGSKRTRARGGGRS